jgi:hypothetical protein
MDYLKIGRIEELTDTKDKRLYRFLEILPGALSWLTLITLVFLSWYNPIFTAYFIIAFDVYWLLLVIFLGIHLLSSYSKMKSNTKIDWKEKCESLGVRELKITEKKRMPQTKISMTFKDIVHLVILPTHKESYEVVDQTIKAIIDSGYPLENMIIALTVEERAGEEYLINARKIGDKYRDKFRNFLVTAHPDGISGEIKAKGANQAWAAKVVQREIIDKEQIDYNKIVVSVFDIDTIIFPMYFYCLSYKFLTTTDPYRASYQPIPVYHNNVWQASFFARVAASSNTFWQMMQQIRVEKLATYSSHSMTWNALVDIDFWSTTMVSEDSRIFWHCFCHYNGDYRVEPLHYPVSMDVTMDSTVLATAKNLYIQQRRWGWGVENLPYLIFNTIKRWKNIPKSKFISRILVQLHGFHSWATNAIIIGIIGWLPMLFGGDTFNSTALSTNLPVVTRTLMMAAMSGLVLSAIVSTLLLPSKPKKYSIFRYFSMLLEWIVLPFSIIIFGSIPGIEAQTRMLLGKPLGFFVTPKKR